jgi:glucose-6-phosphate isomerase
MIKLEKIYPELTSVFREQSKAAMDKLWQRSELGFLHLAERSRLWSQSQERASQLKQEGVRRVVLVGMGGSSLGPKVFWDCFGKDKGELDQMIFLDNLDSTVFFRTLKELKNPREVHFCLVSKSGTTLETLAMADFIDIFLKDHGSELSSKCTVVSEVRTNSLSDWARSHQIPILEIPEDVGGRFSVLSPVGLLPAALMGCSLEDIRAGMQWTKQATGLVEDLVAAAAESIKRRDQALYFWPYFQGCEVFGGWFQQLWAESLGKSVRRDGKPADMVAVPVPSLGPRDQHSTLQQVMECPQPRWVWILKNRKSEQEGPRLKKSLFGNSELRIGRNMNELVLAQADATQSALIHNGIPIISLSLSELSPKTIGALFFLMELVIGGVGEIMGINAFDQPGVELGKKLTKELLMRRVGE